MLDSLLAAGGKIADLIIGSKNASANRDLQAKQMNMQEQFAKSGIQWKVEDAKAAGVHPLFALGAQTHSYAPISVGSTSMPTGFSGLGQDLGRAAMAAQSPETKVSEFTAAAQRLTLEKGAIENEILKSQLARMRQTPTVAIPTGANPNNMLSVGDPAVAAKVEPLKRTSSNPDAPQSEHAAIPDVGYARTSTGHAPVPSENVKERIEDNFIQELLWAVRNNLLPSFGSNQNPPYKAPPGKAWFFHPIRQEYQLIDGPFPGRK